MPTEKDMSEWYVQIKRNELSQLVAQHNEIVEQIKNLDQHIVECDEQLSKDKENENDGNTVSTSPIPNN
tara:strand:- start:2833 stop:3039 length:207 start_codon:yes stop_codon:yes gene_type:complete